MRRRRGECDCVNPSQGDSTLPGKGRRRGVDYRGQRSVGDRMGNDAKPMKSHTPGSSPPSCRKYGIGCTGAYKENLSRVRCYCQMSQAEFFSRLTLSISKDRFAPYYSASGQGDSEAYGIYAWNLALCESLYPALNCLEISLRNSIHQAVSTAFEDEFWFRSRLTGRERETIQNLDTAFASTIDQTKPGRYISECSFGFWVGLFRGDYEQTLWTRLLPVVFPQASRRFRNRSLLYARLNRIRVLRNRIFHHEPIWHIRDLPEQHQLILETIGWISPAMLAMTRLLDRFDSVYTRGAQYYAIELDRIAQDWSASSNTPGG